MNTTFKIAIFSLAVSSLWSLSLVPSLLQARERRLSYSKGACSSPLECCTKFPGECLAFCQRTGWAQGAPCANKAEGCGPSKNPFEEEDKDQ